jgi:hypothetical protein
MLKKYQNYIILFLLFFVFISSLGSFYLSSKTVFADEKGYWLMSEGLKYGRFSSWYFLKDYYPETLRTPGYPVFLLMLRTIWDSKIFVISIQLGLYFLTLFFAVKILNKLSNNNKTALILFLLLLVFNIQIPFYSGIVGAESLTILFTTIYAYIFICRKNNFQNAILIGIVAGLNFLMRPSFLLFPFFIAALLFFFNRSYFKFFVVHISVLLLMLIPFSIWNYQNHGVIKPTPIEGGAGVAHMGYWSFKLPCGYLENFYWWNKVGCDLTNPLYLTAEEYHKNKLEYEREWKETIKNLDKLQTEKDISNFEYMKNNNPGIFYLRNSQYTLERDKMLWKNLIEKIKEDPFFYIKSRIYSFFRFYFTGIDYAEYNNASTLGKLKLIFPFIVTLTCILFGLFFSIFYLIYNKIFSKEIIFLLSISLYQGLIHIPFAIQARYTVPVHLFILILLSTTLFLIFKTKKSNLNNPELR